MTAKRREKRHIAFSDGEMPPCNNVGSFYIPVKWKPSNEPYRRMSPVIDGNTCKTCRRVRAARRQRGQKK
jgi:hypothetical protein